MSSVRINSVGCSPCTGAVRVGNTRVIGNGHVDVIMQFTTVKSFSRVDYPISRGDNPGQQDLQDDFVVVSLKDRPGKESCVAGNVSTASKLLVYRERKWMETYLEGVSVADLRRTGKTLGETPGSFDKDSTAALLPRLGSVGYF